MRYRILAILGIPGRRSTRNAKNCKYPVPVVVLLIAAAICAPAQAAREAVLKQVDVPHSYYWREMYVPQPTSGPSAAAFMPDGRQVVYSMAGSLWLQEVGRDEARELTHGPGYDLQPDVSADGRWVVFARYHQDAMELWRLELGTGREQALTKFGAVNLEPRFSPDGRRLAFVSTQDTGRFNLFVADIDAQGLSDIQPLVAPRRSAIDRYYYSAFDHAINPSWSPDGSRVYYVGNPEVAWGSGDLWWVSVADPDQRQRVLVEETTWAARPEPAPDGRRLMFSSYHGRQWHQIWLTTPEGRSPLPLTFGEFDRRNARWSRDGERILYISNELTSANAGNTSLWVHQVIGGERTAIVARTREHKQPMAKLSVSLRDERGQPLSGRIMVLASDARYYAPPDRWLHGDDNYDRKQQAQENRYFHCSGMCTMEVPVGPVTLWAMQGFERTPVHQQIDLEASGRELALTLAAQPLPAKFGAHTSADLHVHMNYGGHYRQQLEGLAAQAQAEDLDIVYNLVVNKEQRFPDIHEFTTAPRQIGPVTIFQAQELHTSYWGHVGALHLDEHLLMPDFSSYRHTALGSPYPHNALLADLAHQQNALLGYVHPFDLVPDPQKDATLTNALPADVALGKMDYLEVVSFADHRATAEVWYRLMNLGFRLAAGAGTDAMTNYASLRGPVGLNRVYLATSERTPAALRKALKQGNGFVTNAPMLGLRVDGKAPGETLAFGGSRRVRVEAAVRSIVPLSDIELVLNGRVIRRIPADGGGRSVDFETDVTLTSSGWLLLRASNTQPQTLVQDLYPYATTNPVWIEAGTPAPAASADAQYFMRWIDRVIESAAARTDFNTEREREQTLRYLRDARDVFATRALGATGGEPDAN